MIDIIGYSCHWCGGPHLGLDCYDGRGRRLCDAEIVINHVAHRCTLSRGHDGAGHVGHDGTWWVNDRDWRAQ